MAEREPKLSIYEAINSVLLLLGIGRSLTELQFALALGFKGYFDAAASISSDLRAYGLIEVINKERRLTDRAIALAGAESEDAKKAVAMFPVSFRKSWERVAGGDESSARTITHNLRCASIQAGFLNPDGSWNRGAIRAAIAQGFHQASQKRTGAVSAPLFHSRHDLGLTVSYELSFDYRHALRSLNAVLGKRTTDQVRTTLTYDHLMVSFAFDLTPPQAAEALRSIEALLGDADG